MPEYRDSFGLAVLLVKEHFAERGLRTFTTAVAYGLLFLGITVLTALSPGLLTGPTQDSIRRQIEVYFTNVEGKYLYAVALFLIQGPFILTIFTGIIGVRVGQRLSSKLVSSGRFELLLSAPYDSKQIFRALLIGSFLMTFIQLLAFTVLSIGGPLLFLVASGAQVLGSANVSLLVGFVIPIPLAVWANLCVIFGTLGLGSSIFGDSTELYALVGYAPSFLLMAIMTFLPLVDIALLIAVTLAISVAATALGSWWVSNWFKVERVLSTA